MLGMAEGRPSDFIPSKTPDGNIRNTRTGFGLVEATKAKHVRSSSETVTTIDSTRSIYIFEMNEKRTKRKVYASRVGKRFDHSQEEPSIGYSPALFFQTKICPHKFIDQDEITRFYREFVKIPALVKIVTNRLDTEVSNVRMYVDPRLILICKRS